MAYSTVLNQFQQHLDCAINTYANPGASLVVLRGGKVYSVSAGVLNTDTQVDVTVDSAFQIGSISKVLTATLVMQLIDSGEIELDRPILDYLPSLRFADDRSNSITVRHLLSHSSGLDGDFFIDGDNSRDKHSQYVEQCGEIPFLFAPGQGFSYCNSGFVILGRLVEVIVGKTWDDVLKERLFDPLGMKHVMSNPVDALRFRVAMGHVGYQNDEGKQQLSTASKPYLSLSMGPAGTTVMMSASDLMKFVSMHLNHGYSVEGEQILSTPVVEMMQQAQIELPPHSGHGVSHCGLGWLLYDLNNGKGFGHDGATIGQNAFLRVFPEQEAAIILLTNSDGRQMFNFLLTAIFEDRAGAASITPDSLATTAIDLMPYTGCYKNLAFKAEVFLDGQRLKCKLSNTVLPGGSDVVDVYELEPIDSGVFATTACAGSPPIGMVIFSGDEAGSTQLLFNRYRALKRV